MTSPPVSLILPAYNEAARIQEVLSRIPSDVFEIIVVDDGSQDDTAVKAASFTGVTIVHHRVNLGKGAALQTGAEASSGGILAFMDADGQNTPQDLTKLVNALKDDVDIVVGSRMLGKQHIPFPRNISNAFARIIFSLSTGLRISDPLSGFRLIRRSAWDKMALTHSRYEIELEVLFEAARLNLTVSEVPVSVSYSVGGSNMSVWASFKTALFLLSSGVGLWRWRH